MEEVLAGRASRLKGYTIATAVFDRPDSFDAHADPIVRVEAAKLRSRLEHYYYKHGATGCVHITLPKGGYVPEFSIFSDNRDQVAAGAPAPSNTVFRAKPEYLFVMKALSSRGDPSGREDGDMKKLIQTLGLSGVQDAMALVERYFPAKAIGMEVEPGLKAIFDAIGSGEDDRKG